MKYDVTNFGILLPLASVALQQNPSLGTRTCLANDLLLLAAGATHLQRLLVKHYHACAQLGITVNTSKTRIVRVSGRFGAVRAQFCPTLGRLDNDREQQINSDISGSQRQRQNRENVNGQVRRQPKAVAATTMRRQRRRRAAKATVTFSAAAATTKTTRARQKQHPAVASTTTKQQRRQ